MIFCVENETARAFPFDVTDIATRVAECTLAGMQCPFEVSATLIITDDDEIRVLNRTHRQTDHATDVLSFPALTFEAPGIFDASQAEDQSVIDPETGAVWLGDIVISADRVFAQAEEYGHTPLREFAFLTAHAMLHLTGYDHETEAEAAVMEAKQDAILNTLGITRGQDTDG